MNVIVGDRMQAFAATTEAMTLTEFLELPRPTSKTVVIGQGLNLEQNGLPEAALCTAQSRAAACSGPGEPRWS